MRSYKIELEIIGKEIEAIRKINLGGNIAEVIGALEADIANKMLDSFNGAEFGGIVFTDEIKSRIKSFKFPESHPLKSSRKGADLLNYSYLLDAQKSLLVLAAMREPLLSVVNGRNVAENLNTMDRILKVSGVDDEAVVGIVATARKESGAGGDKKLLGSTLLALSGMIGQGLQPENEMMLDRIYGVKRDTTTPCPVTVSSQDSFTSKDPEENTYELYGSKETENGGRVFVFRDILNKSPENAVVIKTDKNGKVSDAYAGSLALAMVHPNGEYGRNFIAFVAKDGVKVSDIIVGGGNAATQAVNASSFAPQVKQDSMIKSAGDLSFDLARISGNPVSTFLAEYAVLGQKNLGGTHGCTACPSGGCSSRTEAVVPGPGGYLTSAISQIIGGKLEKELELLKVSIAF